MRYGTRDSAASASLTADEGALLRRSAEHNKRAALILPPAAATFVALTWRWGSQPALVLWVCAVVVMTFAYRYVAELVASELSERIPRSIVVRYGFVYFMGGTIWGTFPLFVVNTSIMAQAIVAMLLIASLTGGFMFGGSHAASFYAFQVPMVGIGLLSTHNMAGPLARPTAIFLVCVFCYTAVLAHANRSTYREVVRLARANELMATRLGRLNTDLAYSAAHDSLTDLPNRARFHVDLAEELAYDGDDAIAVGVLMVDLDRFKQVNDSLGHGAGDVLLIQVAERVSDALDDGETLYRLGGDEFVVLVEDAADDGHLAEVGERIIGAFQEPFQLGDRAFDTSVSVGAAAASPSSTASGLLKQADNALYRAKDAGRSCVRVFDHAARAERDRKFENKAELEAALEDGRIVPWFQPIVDAASGEIVAFEALARWVEGDEVREAADFMTLVDELHLGSTLSLAIAPAVAAFHRLLHEDAQRAGEDPLEVSVNVELWALREFLDRYGEGALDGLVVEVTDRGMLDDAVRTSESVELAVARGARVCLDDIGNGYNSLGAIAAFPFSWMKLDCELVAEVDSSVATRAVVAGCVAMAQRLDIVIIAEGVERESQLRALQELGVPRAQGYLFSRAVPAPQARALLNNECGEQRGVSFSRAAN